MALTDSAVADTTSWRAAARFGRHAVDRFVDQLLTGQAQFRHGAAAHRLLRETGRYKINRAGLTRAVELATASGRPTAGRRQPAGRHPTGAGRPAGSSRHGGSTKTP
jgi:hypothetical protein